jgi:nucleoside-diphosphate-sugar epimerase
LESGFAVSVLNRGTSSLRPLPETVELLRADIADDESTRAALADRDFDVVADFLSYTPDRLRRNVGLLTGHTGQYVFISSASAYAKPVRRLPIVESTPLANPFWQYSRDKIACEDYLVALFREQGFPATIVRPSHTYDAAMVPTMGGWTDLIRARGGKGVVVLGDGTSLWTLTHASDFAYCFTALLGDERAIGDSFHITGDEVLTWNAIYTELAKAAGVPEPHLVHVASETIGAAIPDLRDGLLGDKAHSVMFDNSKVRSIATGFAQRVPFAIGARQIVDFHDSKPHLAAVDASLDTAFDALVSRLG